MTSWLRTSPLLFALALAACGPQGSSIAEMTSTEVTLPNGKKILCQTMVKDIDLMRGMMFQDSLAKDRGMLLLHPTEDRRPAYTYNVKIPLDFIWLDRYLRIVEIAANVPPCTNTSAKQCPLYGGREKSKYIIELNGGEAAVNGLAAGQSVVF